MNKLKYIYIGFSLLLILALVGCSSTELDENGSSSQNLNVRIGTFPAYYSDSNANTRSINVGIYDEGKTTWTTGDVVYLKITTNDGNTHNLTATYNNGSWTLDNPFKVGTSTATIEAWYAPSYHLENENLVLNDGETAGFNEFLTYKKTNYDISQGYITVNFSTRTYSRLRIAETPKKTIQVTFPNFTPVQSTSTLGNKAITVTTDNKGNAYLYGSWTDGSDISFVCNTWADYSKTINDASVDGKSYAVKGQKPAVFGDYYFADGTWGTLSERSGQTPIGVIFYGGSPCIDDVALRRDHPECVHGLAVSLDNSDKECYWQKNYQTYNNTISEWINSNESVSRLYKSILCQTVNENLVQGDSVLNRLDGYNNTKAIEAFNNAEENAAWPCNAVQSVVKYRTTVPAPKISSDWYLPSAKECMILSYGVDYTYDAIYKKNYPNGSPNILKINASLKLLGKTPFCTSGGQDRFHQFYHISIENDKLYSPPVDLYYGGVYRQGNVPKVIRYSIRPVIAF